MNGGYIKSLDGLRAIAILLVMTFHADITYFGWMGVQLFFVLSGFLIISILWKEKLKPGTIGEKLKRFWIRRSLRIFPLYFGFVLLLALGFWFLNYPATFKEYYPYLLTYTFNYSLHLPEKQGPFFTFLWSLSIEEQFYLLFPLIMFFCSRNFIKILMVSIIILAPFIRFALGVYYTNLGYEPNVVANSIYWNTLSHMDAFFLGGLIPVFGLDLKIKKPNGIFYVSFVVVIVAGILNFINTPSSVHYINDLGYAHGIINNHIYVWEYTILNILFASFILILVSSYNQLKFSRLRNFLESKLMVHIGRVSYGMYVFHFGVILIFNQLFLQNQSIYIKLLFFVPYTAVVYLISEISFRYFESPFIKLKEKLTSNSKKNLAVKISPIKSNPDFLKLIKDSADEGLTN